MVQDASDLSPAAVAGFLALQKRVPRWGGFDKRNNHAGHLIGVSDLIDQSGITLPGYTLQIEVKAPIVADRCLYLFGILRMRGAKRRLVYQLEVAPRNKRTHNGAQPIYGPHEHIGNTKVVAVNHPDVDCSNWHGSLRWFFTRTNIAAFEIEDPNRNVEL